MRRRDIDKQILERIIKAPSTSAVIPGSTPVISFGDFTTSSFTTLSINPSSREFLQRSKLIPASKKRLVDKESLKIELDAPVQQEHAEAIWEGCRNYFEPTSNPLDWFDELNKVLVYIDRKYDSLNTCHIDLVQSATFPAWGKLTQVETQHLLDDDFDFFKYQISMPNLQTILINGGKVFDQIKITPGFKVDVVGYIHFESGSKLVKNRLVKGTGPFGKTVIGWTFPLKSLHVSNPVRKEHYEKLGQWLKNEVGM